MVPKVSVVVPVYQVEKYLAVCVDSLLAQTLPEIEIILVDDGSFDSGGQIADRYAEKYPSVRVIHQKNMGLGPARNSGMKLACGEYVGFVDSDDWVDPQMYRRLYDAAEGRADIVVSGHTVVRGGVAVQRKQHPLAGAEFADPASIAQMRKSLYGHAVSERQLLAFPSSVCMSIYRRSMLEENGLQFEEILSEDLFFNLRAYRAAGCIRFTDGADYFYRKDEQVSITASFTADKIRRFSDFLEKLFALAEEEGEDCVLRAKKLSIDYCRMYVGIVEASAQPFAKKIACVREFVQCEKIRRCWEGYPFHTLSLQQRIFHRLLLHENYAGALLLTGTKKRLKKYLRR